MAVEARKQGHHWRFNRLGGFDQVVIDSGDDIRHLPGLEQKLWAALSCPATGVEFDERTLQLLDVDGDGRIRVNEILAAVTWTCGLLKDPGDLLKHNGGLPLAAINDGTDEGRRLLMAAKRILDNLGKRDQRVITAAETADTKQIFAGTRFNGDGVIPPSAAEDPAVAKAIEDIMACVGTAPDRSEADGIDQALCDAFFAEAAAFLEWWAEADASPARLLPLGNSTTRAAEAYEAIKDKIDDYFTRANLAVFDARAADLLNPGESDYSALKLKTLSAATEELGGFPLARIEPGRPLPLSQTINPGWQAALHAFRTQVAVPLLGPVEILTHEQWIDIRSRFEAHSQWRANARGTMVAPLGRDRIKQIVTGGIKEDIDALIAKDAELEGVMNAIDSVDRLLHYYQYLDVLLQNFVSLRDFYTPGKKAIFQAGTLYLDGRSCELCIRVHDIAKHSELATLSQIYLAYCECRRRGGDETMTIAAAFTEGDSDNLMVGRNGVFYDRKGNDWDATIVRVIEHPISVRQAFWSPYKRIGRMISQQIEKFASSQDKAVEESAAKGVADAAVTAQAPKAAAPAAPFDIGKFAGIFAAIGLAVGAIGTALAAVLTGFLSLAWWQMPLAVVGLMLLVSGPSMLLAYMKLRQRNLGPLLDANGWAVNTAARINIPFGATLTAMAQLPRGAERSLRDPFAEKKAPWKTYLVLLALIAALAAAWQQGYLASWWGQMRQTLSATGQPEASRPADPVGEAKPAG